MRKSENSQNSQKSLTLCERLRSARESMPLSRQELANRLGLSGPSQLSRYETGKTLPTIPILQKYAAALHVDLHWLITGAKSPAIAYAHRQAAKGLRTALPYISAEIDYLLREQARTEQQITAAEAAKPPRSTEHHRRYHTEISYRLREAWEDYALVMDAFTRAGPAGLPLPRPSSEPPPAEGK